MKQTVNRRQNLLDIMLVLFAKTISRLSVHVEEKN